MNLNISATNGYETLNVEFEDGAKSAVRIYSAKNSSRGITVIVIPALGVRMSYYHILALELTKSGINCMLTEMRGTGESQLKASRKNSYGFKEAIYFDISRYLKLARSRNGSDKIYLIGHSLGGQICALASTYHTVDGVLLVASGSNYWRLMDARHGTARLFKYMLSRFLCHLFGYFPGDMVGFAGREGKAMVLDWTYEGIFSKYKFAGQKNDHEALLSQVSTPFLFLPIESDNLVSLRDATFLAEKLKSSQIVIKLLKNKKFTTKVDHFRWVQEPEPIVNNFVEWIEKNGK